MRCPSGFSDKSFIICDVCQRHAPTKWIKNKSYSAIFADDLVHVEIYRKEETVTKRINSFLLQTWLDKRHMCMAVHKCSYTIFNNQHRRPPDITLSINNQLIERADSGTLLGVTYDHKLNFAEHTSNILNKCSDRWSILHTLAHKSWHINNEALLQIYNALINSTFEYSSVLAPCLSNNTIAKLQIIQYTALRAALRVSFNKKTNKIRSNRSIHSEAKIPMVIDRLKTLAKRYITNALAHNNPIIVDCTAEFIELANLNGIYTPTLFNAVLSPASESTLDLSTF